MISNKPKVSVLVPIYNVETYLKQCLDSLINQTLKDIEFICINDGSTDSSAQILLEYSAKDNRIKVINKENSGYGATMNIGLNAASGEYIGIVEPDDYVDKNMFEDLYNIANNNSLDVVKSDFYFYTGTNNRARKAGKIKKQNTGKVMSVKDDLSILKIMPSIWSAIYKKDFLQENAIRFLETPGASYQDTSFAFKSLAAAKRLMFTDKAYLYYRQDNENSSVKSKSKVYAICSEWEEISEFINKRPELKEIVNDALICNQFNAYRWNVLRIADNYKEEFIEKYSQTFKAYLENGEINKNFYKKDNKKELDLLLNNKAEYLKYIDKLSIKQKAKEQRQKLFSVRINASRVSVVLFGKHLVEI